LPEIVVLENPFALSIHSITFGECPHTYNNYSIEKYNWDVGTTKITGSSVHKVIN